MMCSSAAVDVLYESTKGMDWIDLQVGRPSSAGAAEETGKWCNSRDIVLLDFVRKQQSIPILEIKIYGK